MGEVLWLGLSPLQALGQACVVCNRDYRPARYGPRGQWVVVGRSEGSASPVCACVVGGCADQAAARCYPGSDLAISDDVLSAAGAAYLRACEAGGDPRYADPDPIVIATVAGAAPLLAAAELRYLARLIDHRSKAMPTLPATHSPWVVRVAALRECAQFARQRANQMDPAGARS